MPDLLAATADEYPSQGLGSHPDLSLLFQERWSGPRDAEEAGLWLSGQERGWEHGDWLTFAVTDVSQDKAVGHVGLWNRDGGQVGSGEQGEIGYWTAADSRGRGIAPAAVRAVTGWAFDNFGSGGLPRIMLVHDLGNPASCRVAAKSGYPFSDLAPRTHPTGSPTDTSTWPRRLPAGTCDIPWRVQQRSTAAHRDNLRHGECDD